MYLFNVFSIFETPSRFHQSFKKQMLNPNTANATNAKNMASIKKQQDVLQE